MGDERLYKLKFLVLLRRDITRRAQDLDAVELASGVPDGVQFGFIQRLCTMSGGKAIQFLCLGSNAEFLDQA